MVTKQLLRTIAVVVILEILVSGCSRLETETVSCGQPAGGQELSMFIVGDAIITQPWSHFDEPEFLQLVAEIRGADVAMANLEMLIHEFKGYAQESSGGTYLAARPRIAKELAWAGFDMVGHANNHTFDYGSIGVLENLENVKKAGLVLAGSGKDLQRARAPAYFRTPKGTVALVSAASTFISYGRASRSRPDLHGRPGLNPLTVSWDRQISFGSFLTITTPRPRPKVNQEDLKGNLEAIREARAKADLVVFSIHAHRQGRWLEDFAHQAIDAGADVFFGHGPHAVRGVEIHKCKPIFYSLGDFVMQHEQVELLPSEFYARYRLADEATPEDAQNVYSSKFGARFFPVRREAWEGIAAVVYFKGGEVTRVRIIPVDLGFEKPVPLRGRPKLAGKELGKKIIGDVMEQSRDYRTAIEYLESENVGIVEIK